MVGDDGVGKSTIITSLIKESFVQHVQHVVPEVTIPPEVTPENVTTCIIDSSSSSSPSSRQHLLSTLPRAHVICLVYSIADPATFDRVAEYWLPLFRREGVNVPVILVGNKIDMRGGEVTNEALEEEIGPLMSQFKEIETVVECSAKIPLNVSEVFYFAQKAVLHPTAPLYDSREHILKPKCTDALRRIFKVSDQDKDGLLNANELNAFQQKCFSTPLQLQELEGILELVRAYDPSCVQPVLSGFPSTSMTPSEGITELGFLYLHTIFVQQGRMETTWTVLRKFGYGEGLELIDEVLSPRFDVPGDCSVELSPLGNQFLTDIFEAYDRDQDGALSQSELDDLFSTSPGNPWLPQGFPDTTITDEMGKVTLQGWLAQWSMTTLLDHKTTLSYLAFLGYTSSPSSLDMSTTTALKVTRPRKTERRQKKVTRNVFLCYVVGAAGSGKTSLLRSFLSKRFRGGELGDVAYEPTSRTMSVVNSVEMGGGEKYLVLQEFGSKYESEVLRSRKKLEQADVIIYLYDSSDANSFSYVANIREQYSLDHIPSVFVATKADLDLTQQRYEVQPDVYARKLGLPVPMSVSVRLGPVPNLWTTITRVALDPNTSMPRGPSSGRMTTRNMLTYLGIAGATGGVAAIVYALIRNNKISLGWIGRWWGSIAGGLGLKTDL